MAESFAFAPDCLDDAGSRMVSGTCSGCRYAHVQIWNIHEVRMEIAYGAVMRQHKRRDVGQETPIGALPSLSDLVDLQVGIARANPCN